MNIEITIKHNGIIYTQPDCRMKIMQDKGVNILIKKDGKFVAVNAELLNFKIINNE